MIITTANIFKVAFIAIFILSSSLVSSYAGEISNPASIDKKETDDKKINKRAKKLLSTFLFLKLAPAKKRFSSTGNPLSLHSSSTRYSGWRTKAVKDVYRKFGFNELVELRLQSFSERKYDFEKRLELSGKYVGDMKSILSEKGLPKELVYLPLIESGFNPYAYSQSRAAGPWQFMPVTAKQLGLKIDWWVDERRDPIKSTKAAAAYLSYLHKKFGSWPLALAAYNAGEGRMSDAIKKSGEEDFWTIRNSSHIKKETKNYVPSYIAATAIATYPEKFGFKDISYQKPLHHDEVVVHRPIDFSVIAKLAKTDISRIRDLNPELKRWCTPPNALAYNLRIPKGSKDRFVENLARIRGDELDYARFYEVKKGDTVEKIARKLGLSIKDIIEKNELGRNAIIVTGKKILVPIEKKWVKMINKLVN